MGPIPTVVRAAWKGAGSPAPAGPAGPVGTCARCADVGPTRAITEVVSRKFTAVDSWSSRLESGLCSGCAWAYTTRSLRTDTAIVEMDPPAYTPITRTRVLELLSGQTVGPDLSVIVPLHPGRKHLISHAQWGQIAIDDVCLRWSDHHAGMLANAQRLRELGVAGSELLAPVVPYRSVRSKSPADLALIFELWATLEEWRTPANPYGLLLSFLMVPSTLAARDAA